MTLPGALVRSLAGIVGEPHVLTGDAAAGFAVDWTEHGIGAQGTMACAGAHRCGTRAVRQDPFGARPDRHAEPERPPALIRPPGQLERARASTQRPGAGSSCVHD